MNTLINFLFQLSYLNSNFALSLGYLNPALKNQARLFLGYGSVNHYHYHYHCHYHYHRHYHCHYHYQGDA